MAGLRLNAMTSLGGGAKNGAKKAQSKELSFYVFQIHLSPIAGRQSPVTNRSSAG
jgi:hypothetical protein